MEIIRKQINLDKCKSHRNGALPYIEYGTGIYNSSETNYGHFVCDLSGKTGDVKYLDILNKYNFIEDKLFHGIYCRAINESNLKIVMDNITGLECENITSPENFYDYIPLDINNFIKDGEIFYKKISGNNLNEGSFYVLLLDYDIIEKYNQWGIEKLNINTGLNVLTFYKYVRDNILNSNGVTNFSNVIPTVDIPILLEEEYNFDTLYYPYEYSMSGDTLIYIGKENNNRFFKKDLSLKVESKLSKLFHYSAIEIAEGYYGILEDYNKNGGTLLKCTYNNGNWTGTHINTSIVCGDGEDINSFDEKYRNITFFSCIPYYVPYPNNNDVYYFMVRYKNDEDNKLTFPFIQNEAVNIETYEDGTVVYDMITNIDRSNIATSGICIIDYVIGATSGKTNTGIHYTETLNYHSGKIEDIYIDNVEKGDLYYEMLDYDTNTIDVYNSEFDMTIPVRTAIITSMEIGIDSVELPLVTKEGLEHLYNVPSLETNIVINRGVSAGWEKHFKLSECNTMQDLENYGNNIFNL